MPDPVDFRFGKFFAAIDAHGGWRNLESVPSEGRGDLLVAHVFGSLDKQDIPVGTQNAAGVGRRVIASGILEELRVEFGRGHLAA